MLLGQKWFIRQIVPARIYPISAGQNWNEVVMKKFAYIGIASALVIGVAAYAAQGDHGKWDGDGNGTISKQEALAMAAAHFAKMDADGNGVLNADDRKAKQKEHFAKIDSNGDGAISEDEFMARHAMHDENKDGYGKKRFRKRDSADAHHMGGGRALAMLAKADKDGDRSVTRAEFDAAVAEHFAKVDKDGNGEISAEERRAAHEAMGRMHRRHGGN